MAQMYFIYTKGQIIEPPHEKTNKISFAPSEDSPAWAFAQSDQSSLSARRNIGSSATHWAHYEDWSYAQADLSLRCAQVPYVWFCHEAAQLFWKVYCQSKLANLVWCKSVNVLMKGHFGSEFRKLN